MKLKRRHRVLGIVRMLITLFALWLSVFIKLRRDPIYDGRRVGEWFNELCIATNPALQPERLPEGVRRSTRARSEFAQTESNAVPFLLRKQGR